MPAPFQLFAASGLAVALLSAMESLALKMTAPEFSVAQESIQDSRRNFATQRIAADRDKCYGRRCFSNTDPDAVAIQVWPR